MPLVVLARKADKVDEVLTRKLVEGLPAVVADALGDPGTDGAALVAEDVEVWVQDFGPHDVNTKDVEVVIWANLFASRQAFLSLRRAKIGYWLRKALPEGIKGYVWIMLQSASYGEF